MPETEVGDGGEENDGGERDIGSDPDDRGFVFPDDGVFSRRDEDGSVHIVHDQRGGGLVVDGNSPTGVVEIGEDQSSTVG